MPSRRINFNALSYRLDEDRVVNRQHKQSKRTRSIKAIYIHVAQMKPDITPPYNSARRLNEWLASKNDSPSWHFAVDSRGVDGAVHPDKVANHCVGSNGVSVGIECCLRFQDWSDSSSWRDQLFDNLVVLVASLCLEYDIPAVHPEVTVYKQVRTRRSDGTYRYRPVADADHLPSGILGHYQGDPERRPNDPGPDFPWVKFIEAVNDEMAVMVTKEVRKQIAEEKQAMDPNEIKEALARGNVPLLTTENVDFLQAFIRDLDEMHARPSSLGYVLEFYRGLAARLDIDGNQPGEVVDALMEILDNNSTSR